MLGTHLKFHSRSDTHFEVYLNSYCKFIIRRSTSTNQRKSIYIYCIYISVVPIDFLIQHLKVTVSVEREMDNWKLFIYFHGISFIYFFGAHSLWIFQNGRSEWNEFGYNSSIYNALCIMLHLRHVSNNKKLPGIWSDHWDWDTVNKILIWSGFQTTFG